MNTINLELILFSLSGLIIISLFNFYIYNSYKSLILSFTVFTQIVSVYILTIFPGGKILQNYLAVLLFIMVSVFLIFNFKFSDLYQLSKTKLSFSNSVLIIFLLTMFFSIFIFNISDLKNIYGISKVGLFFMFPVFYCFYLPNEYYKYPQIIIFILKFFIWIGLVTSLAGILFFIFGFNLMEAASNASLSFFRHPNTCAFIYSFSIPVILYIILFEKKRLTDFQKLYLKIILIINYVALLLTLSRAGYLASLVSSMILLYSYKKKIFIYVIGIFALIFTTFIQKFFLAKGSVSSISRLGLLYSAVEMLKSSSRGLYWGFGTMSVFQVYTEFKFQLGPLLEDVAYPHNSILFFIMNFGLFAFLSGIVYLIILLADIIKIILADFEENKFLLLPLSIVAGILFQSLLEDTILFPDFFVFHMFFIFFGFLVYYRKNSNIKKYLLNLASV